MSIEAKDIYTATVLDNTSGEGYRIRNKSGEISLKKFINTLDWSLDTIKLREVYEKETRRRKFYFKADGKKYTQVVINVKFSYSYKEFNKIKKNLYVRSGSCFQECVMEDGAFVKDGKLIAIETEILIRNPLSQGVLGEYFVFEDGCYAQKNIIPVLMSKSDLRHYIYKNGFVCDGIKYVRYKRSSGSSRVGKCLFVNEVVYDRMEKWDKCGLDIKEDGKLDLAEWEAYISLPMSSIIDTIELLPENILVIDDFTSYFEDAVVAVSVNGGKLTSKQETARIGNKIWDGESLLDSSCFGKYSEKGMLLLRNRFFKTCAFNTNLQKWFADNNITEISQLKGSTVAQDISQIKMITTPSSIKYLKFGALAGWLENLNTTFGVVKYEKETHFFGGRMVQSHYQLLNTLQLTYYEVESILAPSLGYISGVRKDPEVLRYHVGFTFKNGLEGLENDVGLKLRNDIVFKLLGINNDFAKTEMYRSFKTDIVKGFLRNLKRGHVLLQGNYSTLFGNGLEMLKAAIGEFGGESEIGLGRVWCKRFEPDETILMSRSPHITMGNVLLAKNVQNDQINKYFNLTNEIICINAIKENIQQRLNGCDYDSDSVLLTNNPTLIAAAEKNYQKFRVPTCFVNSQKVERKYNFSHKADLDIKTSVNKIGEIVNLSQELNSLFWEKINCGSTFAQCDELYNDICKLSVLSGIEIDKAKKEFIINSANEIAWLKKKYTVKEGEKPIKPMFFKTITTENGYEVSDKIHYKFFKTPMDYLQKIISVANFRQGRECKIETIPFMNIVRKPQKINLGGAEYRQRDEIIQKIREAKEEIRKLYCDYEMKNEEERASVWEGAAEKKRACVDAIGKMSETESIMYAVLKELDKKEYKDVARFVFEVLFGKPNESFFKMINKSKEPLYELRECLDGDITLYDFKFRRILPSCFAQNP